jgi:hypothetical protein
MPLSLLEKAEQTRNGWQTILRAMTHSHKVAILVQARLSVLHPNQYSIFPLDSIEAITLVSYTPTPQSPSVKCCFDNVMIILCSKLQ